MRTHSFIFALVLVLMTMAGCAQKGPVLLDVKFPAAAEVAPAPKPVVGVSPFVDHRGVKSSVVGKKAIPDGQENELVIQGNSSELVTKRLKDVLAARGITVKDAVWDMTAEGIKAEGVDLLIGGEIKGLWVESVSRPFKTNITASVQLRVSLADAAEKKIVRTINLNSKQERENVLFSRAQVEDMLAEAVTAAVSQLLDDEEVKKKIQ
ncbi:MAG: hypothetical protein A2X56_10075 [Nitrospirae bacterium GWC2_57_13]|jgi:predicted small lipoprotein YifL|nr:MAG: hypothetical protein A2X56_10075 [Nitrospirae bacterium GWC2_57_13]OGW46629.1 MAG: hypothetical protein A2X57_04510 [Nitrospirae bacterium GWD2_57_8]